MQRTKIVDLKRSFKPMDPNSLMENLLGTEREDYPEKPVEIIPYEGYNFLPTEYGYRSYFGTESVLNLAGLTSRCSDLLMFQSTGYANLLIALCEDGIWTSNPATAGGVWTHAYTTTFDPAVFENWTFTTIGDALYFYQAGNTVINKLSSALVFTTLTPSFLTMTGQRGLFRAGGRLGMWDSANSISWSSALDFADFTPSLITSAGNATFKDVVGNIVRVLSQADGFIIYATKSIVGVRLTSSSTALWDAISISNVVGVAYPTHVTQGATDAQHFAFTNAGLYTVGVYNQLAKSHTFEAILTDVTDFLKEGNNPVRLFCSEGRYLFISLIDSAYIDGVISTVVSTIPSMSFELLGYDGVTLPATLTSNQTVSLINDFLSPASSHAPYGAVFPKFYGGGWDGTYRAEIDKVAAGIYFTTAVSTTHWGAMYEYAPLKHAASPYSFLNSAPLTVEVAFNTYDSWLTDFIAAQNVAVQAKVASDPVVTIEQFPGVGTYPTIPADPADEIVEFGKLITGVGKDKLIRTGAGTLLNSVVLRRYFTEAYKINKRRDIHYTNWSDDEPVYATWNPADKVSVILSNGNLTAFTDAGEVRATVGKTAGKWYFELSIDTLTGLAPETLQTVGVKTSTSFLGNEVGNDALGWGYGPYDTISIKRNAGTNTAYGATYAAGDIIGVALDMDAGQVTFYKNGASQGIAFSGLSGIVHAAIGMQTQLSASMQVTANFGASAFTYSVPSGYNSGLYEGGYVLKGTVSTTYEQDTNQVGTYGYSQIFIEATEFNKYQKDKDGNWSLIDTVAAGEAVPPVFDNSYPLGAPGISWITYGTSQLANPLPEFSGTPYGSAPATPTNPYYIPASALTVTLPGATFSLTAGVPAPIYPTYVGALVLDMQLKKWGKFKGDHKLLVDYNPQNASLSGSIPYTNFGIRAGTLKTNGTISLFDNAPADSWIRYGKLGYYRTGITKLHEVRTHYRDVSTGVVTVETSLDGRNLELGLSYFDVLDNNNQVVSYLDVSGRWHTIKISGQWDLSYLELRGTIAGRR